MRIVDVVSRFANHKLPAHTLVIKALPLAQTWVALT
jgi:hypothetical protein